MVLTYSSPTRQRPALTRSCVASWGHATLADPAVVQQRNERYERKEGSPA